MPGTTFWTLGYGNLVTLADRRERKAISSQVMASPSLLRGNRSVMLAYRRLDDVFNLIERQPEEETFLDWRLGLPRNLFFGVFFLKDLPLSVYVRISAWKSRLRICNLPKANAGGRVGDGPPPQWRPEPHSCRRKLLG